MAIGSDMVINPDIYNFLLRIRHACHDNWSATTPLLALLIALVIVHDKTLSHLKSLFVALDLFDSIIKLFFLFCCLEPYHRKQHVS